MSSATGSPAERFAFSVITSEETEVVLDPGDAFPGLEHADAEWIASMSEAGAMRTIAACEAAIGRMQAVQLRALARLGALRESARSAAGEVALAVASTETRARQQLDLAETLTTRLPNTLAAMESGDIDAYKASKVADATAMLDDEQAREADSMLSSRLAGKNPAGLRQAAARVAARIDPEGAADRAAARRLDRRVELTHQSDGMATLAADLPADTAGAIYSRLDHLARERRSADDPRTLDQLRADVLAELCLGCGTAGVTGDSATPTARPRAEIFVYVSADTLAGTSDEPGELAGHGPIAAALARHIAHQPGGTWRRILTDPASGHITDVGRTRYRPPAALDDYVRIRDRTCRHPGCHRPTHRGDLDHHREWARDGGGTDAPNLIGYCRRHHRLKGEPGWAHDLDDAGTLHVTTPTCSTYRSSPDEPPF